MSYPRLVADIGGTNARFSTEIAAFEYANTKVFPCKDFAHLSDAVRAYLSQTNQVGKIKNAAIAIPAPILGDKIYMVNSPWQAISQKETKKHTEFDSLLFLNDLRALALAIPHIPQNNLIQIGGTDTPDHKRPKTIIAPGTGLGTATLFPHPTGEYLAIASEGGHASFSPVNEEEVELWEFVHKRFHHVSAERLISGPGLQLIYEGLCQIQGVAIDILPEPSEITHRGITNENWICKQTTDMFCRMLATVAANLVLITTSCGGVYIGGGIIPNMLDYFIQSDFRCRFEDKGRFRTLLVKIPVYVINYDFPAFLGVSHALESYLSKGYVP